MSLTRRVRKQSYAQSEPSFNAQEMRVINCVKSGRDNAWAIQADTGMLITSIRRALTNLSAEKLKGKENKKRVLEAFDTTEHKPTNRNISKYRVLNGATISIPGPAQVETSNHSV